MPGVYARAQVERPGMLDRAQAWWDDYRLADPEHWRLGGGPMFRAVWEDDGGEPQAYALYRLRHNWDEGFPAGKLEVREALGTSPQAMREIWRFLFGVDLVARVRAWHLPPDHPLFLSVTDPRRLHRRSSTASGCGCSISPSALEAREYAEDGAVAFDVRDEFCKWNDGTWTPHRRRRARRGGARRRGRHPSGRGRPRLDLPGRLRLLGAAPHRPGGGADDRRRRRADAMFRTAAKPWCPEVF